MGRGGQGGRDGRRGREEEPWSDGCLTDGEREARRGSSQGGRGDGKEAMGVFKNTQREADQAHSGGDGRRARPADRVDRASELGLEARSWQWRAGDRQGDRVTENAPCTGDNHRGRLHGRTRDEEAQSRCRALPNGADGARLGVTEIRLLAVAGAEKASVEASADELRAGGDDARRGQPRRAFQRALERRKRWRLEHRVGC